MSDSRYIIRKLMHLGIVFAGTYLFYIMIALNFDFLFQNTVYVEPYIKEDELSTLAINLIFVNVIFVVVELMPYLSALIKKPLMALDHSSKLQSVTSENEKKFNWIVCVVFALLLASPLLFKPNDWPILLLRYISSSVALPAILLLNRSYLLIFEDKIQYGGKAYLAHEITDVEEHDSENNEEVVFSFDINKRRFQLNVPLHFRIAVSDHLKRLEENTIKPLNTFEEVPDLIAKPR